MNIAFITKIAREALLHILMLSAPMLGVGMMIGLLVSIFQATTSIQEQTLTFVPKVVAIFLSIIIFSNWMLSTLIEFTKRIFNLIPMMTR
ncbi:MAG: flagellar biosynthesis protein FliQ [Spirochaetes bacterium]|nr:flagellar biosynthesis protein FliQ [Spirochaetota bacterium]